MHLCYSGFSTGTDCRGCIFSATCIGRVEYCKSRGERASVADRAIILFMHNFTEADTATDKDLSSTVNILVTVSTQTGIDIVRIIERLHEYTERGKETMETNKYKALIKLLDRVRGSSYHSTNENYSAQG